MFTTNTPALAKQGFPAKWKIVSQKKISQPFCFIFAYHLHGNNAKISQKLYKECENFAIKIRQKFCEKTCKNAQQNKEIISWNLMVFTIFSLRFCFIYFWKKMLNFVKKFAKCEQKFSHFITKGFVRWKPSTKPQTMFKEKTGELRIFLPNFRGLVTWVSKRFPPKTNFL